MRLYRHDEIVEAMREAICKADDDRYPDSEKQATAALDAMLDAAVRLEAGKSAAWYPYDKSPHWEATTAYEPNGVDYFPAIILRMEASDDA